MPSVHFLISNNRHHTAMFLPVVKSLAATGRYACRVSSLCELRGLVSPTEKFRMEGATFSKVLPFKPRRSPAGGAQTGSAYARTGRQLLRQISWVVLLGPMFQRCLRVKADLVVLPNDAAFPYDYICKLLRTRNIPFLLVQEGIRFPLPNTERDVYGGGGAQAIAAWGKTSAEYFCTQGAPENSIHLTGNPRFDGLATTDWRTEAKKIQERWHLGEKNLLFLSNPIDDQGFCTTSEKMELVLRFVREISPLFSDSEFRLVIKLHARESAPAFQMLVRDSPFSKQVVILDECPLYPLFTVAQAAIVLASTVGLEALLFQLPLGVLEIPRVGFVYDYVKSGAAQGLTWDAPLAEQVAALLATREESQRRREAYLDHALAVREGATERIVRLIERLCESQS